MRPRAAPSSDLPQYWPSPITNLRGVFLAMRAEIPALLESGGGAIVNTASVGGLVGVPGLSSYAASKWAVIGLTKSVALEYATKGIRINCIAPGATATEMLAGGTQEQRDFLASLAPPSASRSRSRGVSSTCWRARPCRRTAGSPCRE